MDKDVVHSYSGKLLSHKKNDILPFATTWIDLEIVKQSEINQRKIIIYMWNLKKKMIPNRNRLTDRHRK